MLEALVRGGHPPFVGRTAHGGAFALAEGALVVEQVVLPVGSTAAALGTGTSAVYVFMESTQAPDEAQPSGADKSTAGGFKPFTERNFRENLARLTGQLPEGAHAHHVFPQKHEKLFREKGINIHDPRFGAWWGRSSHLKNAPAYTARWKKFFQVVDNPSFEQILQFGRELGDEFGFQIHF